MGLRPGAAGPRLHRQLPLGFGIIQWIFTEYHKVYRYICKSIDRSCIGPYEMVEYRATVWKQRSGQ
ncbi:hypothetical protein ANCDUO_08199 [Ancylostoma duodenale]|uniref:Uncharacterized protein n=1 Tax=Ancylostoma duodenale TaxID=51022 RepID=A0A0C2GJY4_9BILA|nr:hypothetical protein ANCDUO_08199 [Ancylostoma duodenale]